MFAVHQLKLKSKSFLKTQVIYALLSLIPLRQSCCFASKTCKSDCV